MFVRKLSCIAGSIFFSIIPKKRAEKPRKIAFLKVGSIGDVIMTTPLVRSVKKRFPDSDITYIVGSWSSGALEGNPYIDNIMSFDENMVYKRKLDQIIKLVKRIEKEEFDVIFVLDKSYLFSVLAFVAGIKTRIGFDRYGEGFANTHNVKYGEARHEIDYYLDLGDFYEIDKSNRKPYFFVSQKDEKKAEELTGNKKYVVIIPGGARNPGIGFDYFRVWPKEKYAELAKILSRKYKIVLIGGKGDNEICNFIADKNIINYIINLCGKTTLKEAGAVIKKASFVICNDSGPMHIASALNDRVISLFGASNPIRKATLNKKSRWIWKDADIYEERYEIFGKRPRSKDFMKRITVEDVLIWLKKK